MSKPKITEQLGGYLFTWEDKKLSISVNRIHIHNDGRTTAELLVETTAEGYSPILQPPTQLNFSAERTRRDLAKGLTEKFPAFDWPSIIDQLAYHVQILAREGEPVNELWTSDDVPPPEWLLRPILYKGLPTIIFGEKAVCKSTLSLAIYACLILPWSDNPLGLEAPKRSIIPLLADYEVDAQIAQYNAKRLQEGMGLAAFPVYHRRCKMPLADDLQSLQRHISAIKAEVIIVDSLGPAVGGDLKAPGEALRFTTALRQLNCAALIIGQTSKDKEAKAKSVFGSTMFEYYARNILEIRKVQEEGEDTVDIALFNTYHNLGRRYPPMGFRLYFNETKTSIYRHEITAPELRERMSISIRILDLLKEGPLTVKDMKDSLGTSWSATSHAIGRLREKEKVVKVGEKWGLLTMEEET